MFNLKEAASDDLARHCADSAALMEGEDPVHFWGEMYPKVIAGSRSYIEEIGLEEAKARFQRGELNFPATIYEGGKRTMERYCEVYVYVALLDDPQLGELIALVRSRYQTRVSESQLYSYQGGNHVHNPPEERPADWEGRGVCYDRPDRTPYTAHDGDRLICVGTADRYGYAQARHLEYSQFETVEEALAALKAEMEGPHE